MKTTVLMPVYNAENFLHDSIGSLVAQTSKNWKLICVDDGSSDNSLDILLNYERKLNEGLDGDWKMKVLTQKNAGPAVARARAIEIADTEYISILDSDDTYAPDYIEKMLIRAVETNADSIVPDVIVNCGGTEHIMSKFKQLNINYTTVINDSKQAFDMTIPWILHGWQMIRTSLAKQYYTIDVASYSNFNSDEYITRLLYLKSDRTVLCDACYHYRIAPNSITRKPALRKLDYLKTLDKLVDLCEAEDVWMKTKINLFNDYYITLKGMKSFINLLPLCEQNEGMQRICNAYNDSYRKKLSPSILLHSPLRTQLKFLLSLVSLRFI